MSVSRTPGRPSEDGRGFPSGCCALSPDALARCRSELSGKRCLLCRRSGIFPAPAAWDEGPGWNVVGSRSVQAIKVAPRGKGSWQVVVFTSGRKVDGRYPIISCDTKERAVRLMFDRAWQIRPACPVPFGQDGETWMCGDLYLTVAEPCG